MILNVFAREETIKIEFLILQQFFIYYFIALELDAFDYKDPFLSYASIENPTDGIKIEKELENAKDDFLSFLNRRKKDSNCFFNKSIV